MIRHIRKWIIWRRHNTNGPFHKFLVLIGFIKSPSMMFISLPEEWSDLRMIKKIVKGEFER